MSYPYEMMSPSAISFAEAALQERRTPGVKSGQSGFASPYSTGGGGTALEFAYGAVLLADLLTSHPVACLGDEVTPREVRFQQSASSPVDDLVVVGDHPAGSRMISIGVRHAPTIGGGKGPFIKLLVDYLRVIVNRQAELDSDRERLGLAIAAPHAGANEVAQLAFLARKQPDNTAFRAFVVAPKHTNAKVRGRLGHLDNAVQAAVKAAEMPLPVDAGALTWRLLRALRIIELRLEGDDPADATNVIGRLKLLTGDAPGAVALWHRLLRLSQGYAQSAARVTYDMLAREVSSIIQVPAPSGAPAGGREEQVHERLRQLPAVNGPQLLSAWRDDQDGAWRLITALTSVDTRPDVVLQGWQTHRPGWLTTASWQVQVAAGDLADAYDADALAAELYLAAAEQGAPRRGVWIARAAMIYDHDEVARQAAVAALEFAADREPYAQAVLALLSGDRAAAARIVAAWTPTAPSDRSLRTSVRLRLAGLTDPHAEVNRDRLDEGLRILAEALRERWTAGLAAARARLLIIRCRDGWSPSWDADLREARTLALRCRDERRAYRGDSAEAAALACQASLLLTDLRQVLALGAMGNDVLSDEAASPLVCEYVAVAAIPLGMLDVARDRVPQLVGAVRARVEGYLAEADGGDPVPLWWRAAELADDDEELAQALLALAGAGVDGLSRYPDFAVRQPGRAIELRAITELFAGRPDAAVGRLRQLRRTSVPAALSLAMAYQKLGNVDAQVQTLRDAADHFTDPSLRHTAAEVLTRADRLAEAQVEVEALLARADPEWGGRAEACRLAAHLASRNGRTDELCRLLHIVLGIEPGDEFGRWALVRALLHRGDLNAAWRVLHEAPEPLEPSSPADAQAWVKMYRRRGEPAEMVAGCLRLLRRFGEDEQFVVAALLSLSLPWPTPVELSEDVRAQIAAETQRFFQRWPDSPHLYRIQTGDEERLRSEMIDLAKRSRDEQVLRVVAHELASGIAPLFSLAVMSSRRYAEICLYHVGGVLPAHRAEAAEFAACTEAAHLAEDHDIVIDTPAIAVLLTLADDVRAIITARFARVVTTDDVMLDALNTKDSLELRSTASWRYDEQRGELVLDEIDEAAADLLALQATRLHDTVEALTRWTAPIDGMFGDEHPAQAVTWAAPLELARAHGSVLWSDDPVLRATAREKGVPATSTVAILRCLATAGTISDGRMEQCIRALIKGRVGDFPLDERRLLDLAEEDNWRPTYVAAAIARPAFWSDLLPAMAFYRALAAQVDRHAPNTLPRWLYDAVRGAVALLARPDQVAAIAAGMLTSTLAVTSATGERVAHLVAATRQALSDTDHPGQPPAGDPLPIAATLLRDAVATPTSQEVAVPYVLATFASLVETDRDIVAKAMLT